MTLRAIGFDLDNTLFDQGQHMRSFFREAAPRIADRSGVPSSRAENELLRVWKHRTSHFPRLFNEVLESLGIDDQVLVRELVALYHDHRATLSTFAGVPEMLVRLRGRFSLFLITDGNSAMQRMKIESLDLMAAFDEVVLTGDFGKEWAKPAPHAFRRVMDRFGGDSSQYVYVGDNPVCDFYPARQLGMRTVRVLTEPFASHQAPSPDHEADRSLRRATDLERVIDDIEKTV
jgi:putative hydrolase of the HAD superfamily